MHLKTSEPHSFVSKVTNILLENIGAGNANAKCEKVILITDSYYKLKRFIEWASDFDEINEKQLETIVVGIHVMLENDPAIQNQISRLKQFKLDINNLKDIKCTFLSVLLDDMCNLKINSISRINFDILFEKASQTVSWKELKNRNDMLVPCFLLLNITPQFHEIQIKILDQVQIIPMSNQALEQEEFPIHTFKNGIKLFKETIESIRDKNFNAGSIVLCTTSHWLVTSTLWKLCIDADMEHVIHDIFIGGIDIYSLGLLGTLRLKGL